MTTRLAATPEMIEHDTVCSLLVQYVIAEGRPIRDSDPNVAGNEDAGARVEQRRIQQLDLLAREKKVASDAKVKEALTVLRTLHRETSVDPTPVERATQLKIVSGAFDSYCNTSGGVQQKATTTLAPLTGPTQTLPPSTTTPATTTSPK